MIFTLFSLILILCLNFKIIIFKAENRHVGDLGNIEAYKNSIAIFEFDDSLIQLSGENSIIGRSFVVHAGEDDLGNFYIEIWSDLKDFLKIFIFFYF